MIEDTLKVLFVVIVAVGISLLGALFDNVLGYTSKVYRGKPQ